MPYKNNDSNLKVDNEGKNVNSYFDGDTLSNIFFTISFLILRIISLDLLSPIVACSRLKWKAEHTYINGRRLIFNGQIIDLLKKNTVWILLSIITFGIFLPFKAIKMKKWEIENTHFVGIPEENYKYKKSEFICSWYKYAGVSLVKFIVTVLTFGIAYFWAYTFKERVLTKCKFIDGHRLEFTATGGKFFLTKLLWVLFTILTIGIYGLLLKGKMLRWQIANTNVDTSQTIIFCDNVTKFQSVREINKKSYLSFLLIFPNLLFMICAWFSRALCRHGINNVIISVPFTFVALSIICSVALFMLSFIAYKNSLQIKSGKYLSIILAIIDIVTFIIGIFIFVYLIILTV